MRVVSRQRLQPWLTELGGGVCLGEELPKSPKRDAQHFTQHAGWESPRLAQNQQSVHQHLGWLQQPEKEQVLHLHTTPDHDEPSSHGSPLSQPLRVEAGSQLAPPVDS